MESALLLFSTQGITATTTKQIAERAGVNEVTLFRQFGSKQGLLLAVLKEAPVLEKMQAALSDITGASNPLTAYGSSGLELLAKVPELVRSLIGEAGQSPPENMQALGQAVRQANQQTVAYLLGAQLSFPLGLSIEAAASLLNTLILGRAVIESTSDGHELWQSQTDFLAAVDALFAAAKPVDLEPVKDIEADRVMVADLPAEGVRSLFQKARKLGAQEYALVYVLFGAGLRVEEAAGLLRSHSFSTKTQHLLTITGSAPRQVPLNRWIMGSRYGTYLKNPLTQWIKTFPDEQSAVFVNSNREPLDTGGIGELWNTIFYGRDVAIPADFETASGAPILPFQARQTWCIELLMKGMTLENLSILSGLSLKDLEAYAHRAKEKAALEQALAIDQKT